MDAPNQEPQALDATLVEWQTLPVAEQRRIIARGLRQIANALSRREFRDTYALFPDVAQNAVNYLAAVQHYIAQVGNRQPTTV